MRILAGLALGMLAAAGGPDELARRRTPVVEVFESARDAVVNISSTRIVEVRDPFHRLFDFRRSRPRRLKRTSVGSGFVIHPDGYIVTNAHVVARSTDRTVIFANGREYDAAVVASDREADVAILKIDAPHALDTLSFGRSSDLMAVLTPMSSPSTLSSGPPELPGLMLASVWIRPVITSSFSNSRSRSTALTTPAVTVCW